MNAMRMYDGATFNKYGKGRMIKLICGDGVHRGVHYKSGLNVDPLPFDPHGLCRPGGLYFCTESAMCEHMYYCCMTGLDANGVQRSGPVLMVWVCDVTIPNDAKVYVETPTRFKADRFILGERRLVLSSLKSVEEQKAYLARYQDLRNPTEPALRIQCLWDAAFAMYPDIARFLPSPSTFSKEGLLSYLAQKEYKFLRFLPPSLFADEEVIHQLEAWRVPLRYLPVEARTNALWEKVIVSDVWWNNSSDCFDFPFRMMQANRTPLYVLQITHGRRTFGSLSADFKTPAFVALLIKADPRNQERIPETYWHLLPKSSSPKVFSVPSSPVMEEDEEPVSSVMEEEEDNNPIVKTIDKKRRKKKRRFGKCLRK